MTPTSSSLRAPLGGVQLWRGPSLLTGDDVVAIVTLRSFNAKTGPMAQAWLLLTGLAPNEALHQDRDRAICGDCAFRTGRSCYVSTWMGPLQVYTAWRRGAYPPLEQLAPADRPTLAGPVRLTAYGDPAAAPFEAWYPALERMAAVAYTHQWATCDPRWRAVCMASVETPEQRDTARAAGWRTYRARLDDEPLAGDEVVCPASAEAGHRTTCDSCMLCRGDQASTVKSIAIQIHGTRSRRFVEQREGMPKYAASRSIVATAHWKGRRS